ncbi:MAG: hypothetical protein WAM28_08455 [Chlamydiales bacterium]
MRKIILFSFLLSKILLAQESFDDPSFEIENQPPPFFPFSLSGTYLAVSDAGFRTKAVQASKLRYRQWDAAYAYTLPLSPICGLIFGAGWVGTEVAMKNNPEFHETLFNYVNLSLGAFTNSFPDWTWTATFAMLFDTEVFSLMDYTLYQGVLWGRYHPRPEWELDFGFITEIGLSHTKIWPILGFIHRFSPELRLNAVFPVNISLEYDFFSCWTFAGSLRFLRDRHRVNQDEPNPQAIFEYRTWGGELDLTFSPFATFWIKGFAGSTLGGDLKVANRNYEHATHFKFKGSFYGGASAVFSF